VPKIHWITTGRRWQLKCSTRQERLDSPTVSLIVTNSKLLSFNVCLYHRRSQGGPGESPPHIFTVSRHFVLWEAASQTKILLLSLCQNILAQKNFFGWLRHWPVRSFSDAVTLLLFFAVSGTTWNVCNHLNTTKYKVGQGW